MVSSVPPVLFRHRRAIGGVLLTLAAACALTACDKLPKPQPPTPSTEAPEAAAPAVAARYTPPSAEVLYQMVAPIALYPDKLVAQILAGATYPDQVTVAETWLGQNPGLKAADLADAADQQPWDPSIKSLTAFPNVLAQMASNLPWTTALGKAYYNDPGDVMNAIQVMRGRASKAGSLKNLPQMRVVTAPVPAVVADAGPVVVPPPATYITIEPTAVDTVYVPAYDPQVVYGTPVPLYPQYAWAAPAIVQPEGPSPFTVGALVFGAGIVVAAAASHHHWGWNAWGMNWAPPPPRPAVVVQGMPPPPPPLLRPSVTYRGNTYVSHSTSVVENIRNTTINNYAARPAPALPAPTAGWMPPPQHEPGRMGQAALQAPGQPPAHMPPPMQQQPDRRIQALQAPAMPERQAQEQQMRRQMQMQQAQHQVPQPPAQAGPQHAPQLQAQQRQAQEEQALRQAQMQQAQQRQVQQQSAQEAQQRAMQQQAQQAQQHQQQMLERQAREEQARRQMQMEQQAQQRQMQEAQQHAMQQRQQQVQQMQERQAQEEQARRQMQMQQMQLHALQQQQAQQRQQQMQEQQRQAQAPQRHEQERRVRPEERQRELR